MSGSIARTYADFIVSHSKLILVVLVLLTGVVAAGTAVGGAADDSGNQFQADSDETDAFDTVQATYGEDNAIVSQMVVRNESGDVLTKESLLAGLRFQQTVRNNETLNATLQTNGFAGIENVVGTVAAQQAAEGPPRGQPTLEEQIAALEDLSEQQVEQLLAQVLDPEAELPGGADPYQLLPDSYEPGSTTADSRLILVFQTDDSAGEGTPQAAYDAQVQMDAMVEDRFDDAFIFGQGINEDASSRAVGDSFSIITPVALVLVLFVLGITYRDLFDVILGIVGIVAVLLWQAGLMGWLQIPMNVILIAVPFLLIGLSIDYALHVVMRYREARNGTLGLDDTADVAADGGPDDETVPVELGVRRGMAFGLAGVVLALAAATFSTGVGFLSNVVSPLPAIRNFAILSAGGIFATFVVFTMLVPALKVELDGVFEKYLGWDRRKQAFGVEPGIANGVLSRLADVVSARPTVVIVVALLLATAGATGATTIDTEFNEADFLPEDAPAWTSYLPGPLEPGSYDIKDNFAYISQNFQLQGPGDRSQVLITGNVTDGATLTAIEDATASGGEDSSLAARPDGGVDATGPHTALRQVAAGNETVAAAIAERDANDDGLPDDDVARVYDLAFDADQTTMSEVVYRNDDGEYESVRLIIGVRGQASSQDVASDTRALASGVQDRGPVTAVATGGPVTTAVVQDALLETLVQAFVITLVVILVFLVALYWVRYRSPELGVLTLAPVVVALCWLLGSMALLGIPFNSETAVITSLAIGLGVDYSIHVGERFADEEQRRDTLDESLRATITGTGGALLGSASTTAAGFGVLALSLSPPLQRFGLVTGGAIVYAFVACLTILPCLLVLRERVAKRFDA